MDKAWQLVTAVVTSWPFWVSMIAVVFLVLFRTNIRELIGRVTGIGRTGITTATAGTIKDAQANPAPDPRAAADELMAQLDNQVVREIEDRLRQELDQRGLAANHAERARVLTRYTAVALMTADFENVEANIFGSQIEILQTLNGVPRAAAASVRPFYDRAVTDYPVLYAGYSFEQYMDFLLNRGLVIRQDGGFAVTVKGRTYLMWRVHQGRARRLL